MISPAFSITTSSPIADVLAGDLVEVVQRRVLDGRARELHGRQPRHRRQHAGLADLQVNPQELRHRLLGLELEGHHPARRLARRAEAALLVERVHLDDHAVELILHLVHQLRPLLRERDDLVHGLAELAVRVHREAELAEGVEQLELRLELDPFVDSDGVSEEPQPARAP